MASDNKSRKDSENTFSFGVRELRQAKRIEALSLVDTGISKTQNKQQGSDPYNTSGSFDRTKNWTRVGKR
jgi:hypothetical protein